MISVSDGNETSALESFDIIVKGALDIAHNFGVATQGTEPDYYTTSPHLMRSIMTTVPITTQEGEIKEKIGYK